MKQHILIISILVLIPSCALNVNLNDPQSISKAIIIERDDFKKVTTYQGPNVCTAFSDDSLFIRAFKVDGVEDLNYQIYVKDCYSGDWRFYESAYDSNGNRIDVTIIDREVASCSRYGCIHFEHIGLKVTRAYLEKNKDCGIRFKIDGKGGEEIFYIPSIYIGAFLSITK